MQILGSAVTLANSNTVSFSGIWFDAVERRGRHCSGYNCEKCGAAYLRGLYEFCRLVQTTIVLIFQDMDYGRKMSPSAKG